MKTLPPARSLRLLLAIFLLPLVSIELAAQGAFGALARLARSGSIFRASSSIAYGAELSTMGRAAYETGYLHSLYSAPTAYRTPLPYDDATLEKYFGEAAHLSDIRIAEFRNSYSPELAYKEKELHQEFLELMQRSLRGQYLTPAERREYQQALDIYITSMQQVRFASTLSGSGGNRIPPHYPTITDYASESAGERVNRPKKEKEKEDDSDNEDGDDNNDDDNDDDNNDDSDQQDSIAADSLRQMAALSLPEEDSGMPLWPLLLTGMLGYLVLSHFGLSRLMVKANMPDGETWLPVWRLGSVFRLCGLSPRDFLILLIPGVNLYYWAGVNYRLCRVFQYPTYLAALGFFAPGLLWYTIGYSNRYYIGPKRANLK